MILHMEMSDNYRRILLDH